MFSKQVDDKQSPYGNESDFTEVERFSLKPTAIGFGF